VPVNYFTLKALVAELDALLCGAVIQEVFTQQRNELLIHLVCPNIQQNKTLRISIEPKFNFLYLSDTIPRARKNSVDLFPEIIDSKIQNVSIHPSDRIIFIILESKKQLIIRLYNTADSNILLIDSNHIVQESFKKNKELSGSLFQPPISPSTSMITSDNFSQEFLKTHKGDLYKTLKKIFPNLGLTYINELLYRTKISSDVTELNNQNIQALWNEIQNIFLEMINPHPFIIRINDTEKILSIIELRQYADKGKEMFISVNEAIKSYVHKIYHEKSFQDKKLELVRKLKDEIEQLENAFRKIEEQILAPPVNYEELGNLILANLQNIKRGMKELCLPNPDDEKKSILIQLDSSLTPVENAQRYFNKAKKSKQAIKEMQSRHHQLKNRLQELKRLYNELDNCSTMNELKIFVSTNSKILKELKVLKGDLKESIPPFRIFTVTGGYEVWVGKSSKNNDLLTIKYSKPNDIWFHARGASGSHTVLKVKDKSKKVPKEAIHQAACIAAYYSKMRKSSNVPVAYCERKYVRKPKNAPEGTVVLEREEVIFVSPALP